MTRHLFVAALACMAGLPAAAQDDDDSAFVTFRALKPEVALEMAVAALEHCRAGGYQVGVTVVDRSGVPQVFFRDRFAGPHVEETARRKAWTAVSFRTDTLTLDLETRPDSISAAIRNISEPLPLGGGVPVEAAGSIVAGIGVSGAPGPDIDDECARAGIAAVEDQIGF